MNESNDDNNKLRYNRWIRYYADKLPLFDSKYLFLIDDGSPTNDLVGNVEILNPDNLPASLYSKTNLVYFKDNLGRPTFLNYRGWWRSFLYSVKIAEQYGFDKIIHVESDFFIVSQRMIEYIRNISTGWTAFYSWFYDFPEAAIQVICKDAFPRLKAYYKKGVKRKFTLNISAELRLPFNKVEKQFYGDRLGQPNVMDQWLKHVKTPLAVDYLGQINPRYQPAHFYPFFEFDYKWE